MTRSDIKKRIEKIEQDKAMPKHSALVIYDSDIEGDAERRVAEATADPEITDIIAIPDNHRDPLRGAAPCP